MLFDVGPYGDVWLANAERLSIDLSTIGTVFLSHWHWDHSGGFPVVIEAIGAARRDAGLPPPVVDLHPDRPDQRGTRMPDGRSCSCPTSSHAGVVNACLEAVDAHDGAPVDLVLGGYHLAGASVEDRIDATVRDLDERVGAAAIAPGHCTGWRAKAALAQRFAGGRYAPSAVGVRYVLA